MRKPDQKGSAASGWLVNTEQYPTAPAHLCSWLVVGSGFHAMWDTWVINSCHLREVPDVDPPKLHYPTAEYEVVIVALNPKFAPYDPDCLPKRLPFLQPFDLVKQFDGCTDIQTKNLVGLMVTAICEGQMSPDQDCRAAWEQLIDSTVACYEAGLHSESFGN